jgi:hypothetical protein
MNLRWIVKGVFFLAAVLCGTVVGIMFSKLSFIDWPYVIGGGVFLILGIVIPVKKRTTHIKS